MEDDITRSVFIKVFVVDHISPHTLYISRRPQGYRQGGKVRD